MSNFATRLKRSVGIAPPRKTEGGVHVFVNARGGLSVDPNELVRSPKARKLMKEVADMQIGKDGRLTKAS